MLIASGSEISRRISLEFKLQSKHRDSIRISLKYDPSLQTPLRFRTWAQMVQAPSVKKKKDGCLRKKMVPFFIQPQYYFWYNPDASCLGLSTEQRISCSWWPLLIGGVGALGSLREGTHCYVCIMKRDWSAARNLKFLDLLFGMFTLLAVSVYSHFEVGRYLTTVQLETQGNLPTIKCA